MEPAGRPGVQENRESTPYCRRSRGTREGTEKMSSRHDSPSSGNAAGASPAREEESRHADDPQVAREGRVGLLLLAATPFALFLLLVILDRVIG